jgi:hypothetical protein
MRAIHATKYYSLGKYSDPLAAQKRVDELKEAHPDREYDLLINMRGNYERYIVAQVAQVNVNWPEDEDMDLPPEPQRPGGHFSSHAQAWEDYRHDIAKRENIKRGATAHLRALLRQKLNP